MLVQKRYRAGGLQERCSLGVGVAEVCVRCEEEGDEGATIHYFTCFFTRSRVLRQQA